MRTALPYQNAYLQRQPPFVDDDDDLWTVTLNDIKVTNLTWDNSISFVDNQVGKVNSYDCAICGHKELLGAYLSLDNKHCFLCKYWLDMVNTPGSVVIDQVHYTIGAEAVGPMSCRGFGGHRYEILFNDGRQVATTNLWYQGAIPKQFQLAFPNTAKFKI